MIAGVESAGRFAPGHYTPDNLPAEVSAMAGGLRCGLDVGAAGKVGLLELSLARSGPATRVVAQYQRAPLYLYRPIYVDPARPDMPFVYVQQSGDGLVQGDRYRIDITCASGAAAHITTQAPTKVFAARSDLVTQMVNLHAGAGAFLEYLPDPMIPCRGSRLFQRLRITAESTATIIFGETLMPGRVAHGESHVYDTYWAETAVLRPDETLLFTDRLRLRPLLEGVGSLGGYDVIASLYLVTAVVDPAALVSELRARDVERPDVMVGFTELPNGCGVAVRVLARTSATARHAMRELWNAARLTLMGLPAPDLRKG
ncbi:urease accessory protein UreD [Nocardioides sp. YIM 152315]|uniref:urease accessory protein UreD n=1 Tax=Nocardioides sp. YIM 152315 TaxID=3031760 RepID=UPI0023D99127|nr:urease accessory protein UreD [Nocardioides sp. YIM 152315]MDF1603221.1 urease accessory protein UreD [Nocardioides sp. YIM 152315]